MAEKIVTNVFISHVHEDDEGLGKLKELLKSKDMHIRDASIHKGKENEAKSPDYIKSEIPKWAKVVKESGYKVE